MVKGLAAIQAALEAEGIEFTDDNGVPGVRLHRKKRKWKWAGPYLWVNCRPAAAAINLPPMEKISASELARRKSAIVRRYVTINGRNSSVCLESAFWDALKIDSGHSLGRDDNLIRVLAHGHSKVRRSNPGLLIRSERPPFARRTRGLLVTRLKASPATLEGSGA
jgi:hypothetical protein